MFPLNLHLISTIFEVTMVENSFHSNPFSKIMVFFSSTLMFTCPNKMGWWNANAATFYKLHEPWNFKLNFLLNFGENVHSPPSISSTAYFHLFSPSKHHSNAFTWNHLLTLTSVCLVVSLMLPMSMSHHKFDHRSIVCIFIGYPVQSLHHKNIHQQGSTFSRKSLSLCFLQVYPSYF